MPETVNIPKDLAKEALQAIHVHAFMRRFICKSTEDHPSSLDPMPYDERVAQAKQAVARYADLYNRFAEAAGFETRLTEHADPFSP